MHATTLGIIGGGGALGSAIARGLLAAGALTVDRLVISGRSGSPGALADIAGLTVTSDTQRLVDQCDMVLLCVPPAALEDLRVDAADRLVVSVVAGLTLDRLAALTGARSVIRAMSSPAAARRQAFSAWIAGPGSTRDDRRRAGALFGAVGVSEEVGDEGQIDLFTALTGPVPGFVAFWAECLHSWATTSGVPEDVARRAVCQLFLGAGTAMSETMADPAAEVRAMLDYGGTTAAGLEVLRASGIAAEAARGLDAAADRARAIADPVRRPRPDPDGGR